MMNKFASFEVRKGENGELNSSYKMWNEFGFPVKLGVGLPRAAWYQATRNLHYRHGMVGEEDLRTLVREFRESYEKGEFKVDKV